MHDTQYEFFQELDRRCVAGGFRDDECREAVRLKKASIDIEKGRGHPIVGEILAGKTSLVAEYDGFSRMFRGVRRFLPMPHDGASNERLRQLARLVPNVRHFTRRSLFAVDNPLTAAVYGVVASLALEVVLTLTLRADVEEGAAGVAEWSEGWLALGFGVVGFLAGALASVRYRTRDQRQIHAREAAAYLDVNYGFYNRGDDRAWAEYIRSGVRQRG